MPRTALTATDRTDRKLVPVAAPGEVRSMLAAVTKDNQAVVVTLPDPQPGRGQVLVAVRAAGLNGADLHQVRGLYPPPPGWPADQLGMEFAGEVAGLGPASTRFSVGDRVMGITGSGSQAQLVVVDEREIMALPDGVPWDQAGGFPEVFTTAHDAIFSQAGLKSGERLLVHGAAGGVGTAAVQLGRVAGASVVATVRNPELRDAVAALGATVVDPADFAEQGPFDVILELVGAPNMEANLASLATSGRIVVIGVGGGASAKVNLLALMGKRGTIRASTLRARASEDKAHAARLVEAQVVPHLSAGTIRVPVHATLPLSQAPEAYAAFAAGAKFGKIVLLNDTDS